MSNTPTPDERRDYWQKQIEAWQASGQSQKTFCTTHAVNYPRFVYWRGKFRRQQARQHAAGRCGFVPVTRSTPQSVDGLCLVLPNGLEVRGIGSNNLHVVQQLLGSLT